MTSKIVTGDDIHNYYQYLVREEKSSVTIDKYLRDAKRFVVFAEGRLITKEIKSY